MITIKYTDTIEPQSFEENFENNIDGYEWINREMQFWYDVFCEKYPNADVTWTNRLLDSGNTTEIYIPDTSINVSVTFEEYPGFKIGDIVRVGLTDHYYMAVVTDINEEEEMVMVKDLSQIEDNIQPMYCVRKATIEEIIEELRSIYGYNA